MTSQLLLLIVVLFSRSSLAEQVAVDAAGSQRLSQAEEIRRSDSYSCVDHHPDCAERAGRLLDGCAANPELLFECAKTCGTCAYRHLVDEAMRCEDKEEACASWAASGECEANPRYMLQSCVVSCGSCESKRSGCARKNTTRVVDAPGGMNAMFERALREYPQYSPTALSTDPYVLQFENFVTAEEASQMVAACPKMDRSMAGDQLSPVRTSTQCWCDDSNGCMSDEAVRTITERMLNITQLPFNNAEYFQVLKYEKGQFYRQHHDQQSGHWTPQGVRLYTFFLYLSDVEEGGGTRFTSLDITVKPKLGRAILWPSVFDHDLRTSDKRTMHEALPVERGVKYAANLWQHLWDFKTPSRSGLCAFLGKNSNH